MPKEGGLEHYVDGTLSMDGNEVCTLNGTYDSRGEGMLTWICRARRSIS